MIPPAKPYRITQICVVVKDLDEAMANYHGLLGWGPWNVYEYEPPLLTGTRLHGRPEDYTFQAAECQVQPGLVVELIQPLEGPSIYKEHLEKYGEGIQHVAIMMPTMGEADVPREHFAQNGVAVSMEGRLGDNCYFYYLETEPQLKFVLESGCDAEQVVDAVRQYPPAS